MPAKDLGWGNDFDQPIRDRLPPGFNYAFDFVKRFVDPGVECDAYADEPWLYGPALGCWFAFRIGEKSPDAVKKALESDQSEERDVVEEGADGSGMEVRSKNHIPDIADKRRKHFVDEANRKNFVFEKGRVYKVDFFNPYLDFSSMFNFALFIGLHF